MATKNTKAGWYPDPEQPAGWRYWDGTAWTERRRMGRGISIHTVRTLILGLFAIALFAVFVIKGVAPIEYIAVVAVIVTAILVVKLLGRTAIWATEPSSRGCPRCGLAVRKGILDCPHCGFDFRIIGSTTAE